MKRVLRERFVSSYYGRDLHNKLQRLIQRNRSVDEYYKEIEISLIRTQIEESQETTMARFNCLYLFLTCFIFNLLLQWTQYLFDIKVVI